VFLEEIRFGKYGAQSAENGHGSSKRERRDFSEELLAVAIFVLEIC